MIVHLHRLFAIAFGVLASVWVLSGAAHAGEVVVPPSPWASPGQSNPEPSALGGEWGAYFLKSDDVLAADEYHLMVWHGADAGERWGAEKMHGGAPAIRLRKNGGIALAARGPWPSNPGRKIPALSWKTGTAGTFTIRFSATLTKSEGGGDVKLVVLHRSTEALSEVLSDALPRGASEPTEIASGAISMQPGDEIVTVVISSSPNSLAEVALTDLEIVSE